MYITNSELLDEKKLFPCKSNKLKKFLVEVKKIPYISRKQDDKSNKIIWFFMKTEKFNEALDEWRNNKKNNTLVYPKE